MTVVIAGGTGFLGRALTDALTDADHDVVILSRSAPDGSRLSTTGAGRAGRTRIVGWTPDGSAGDWASAVDGAEAVINLAGESIAAGRWNEARKRSILDSRLLATRSLVAAIAAARRPPSVLINASAQAYYGERGDQELTEQAGPGQDFLAGVCVKWEAEARQAARITRLVLLRTGIVLSATDGALPRMLLPFKLFGGGPLGSGRQFMSWIHWRDWVGLVQWALANRDVGDALNVSAPTAIRNSEFSAAIGRVLHRPSWLPAPAFAIRTALGEMADALLFTSIRMVPRRPLDLGYRFEFDDAEGALRELLA